FANTQQQGGVRRRSGRQRAGSSALRPWQHDAKQSACADCREGIDDPAARDAIAGEAESIRREVKSCPATIDKSTTYNSKDHCRGTIAHFFALHYCFRHLVLD